jgi:NAD(P)H-nitrite reductase large subunit
MTYTPSILDAPDDELVCYCSKVSKGEILLAVRRGAATLAGIKAITGACAVGRCEEFNPRGRCCSKEILALTCNQAGDQI